jgi:hypothetical protein
MTGEMDHGEAAPWIGYDAQPPVAIARFVAKSSPSQARAVRVYESDRQARAEVIAAADRRLAMWHA